MRRIIYSTKSIDAADAADYMLQEERDMQDYRIPCKVENLPEEMSFREFCSEFYSVVPDDLTDEDYDSLYAKYNHYYDGWDLRPEFR